MNHHPVHRAVKFAMFALVGGVAIGFFVKVMWNILMPPIFGWHMITFWQGLGLFVLSKVLFGGFHRHSGGGRNRWRRGMKERWENMTPEEREKFRSGMRCGRRPFAQSAETQI
ncbi:hypothetical protein [Granulicella sp. S190]|uniref:hypothetical protein n=1 Tax=Granulicella sp. S190 TaxID=1747226 RepID=UPI001C201DA2|nr:hypothetical protein [Granulicella sp. S190]